MAAAAPPPGSGTRTAAAAILPACQARLRFGHGAGGQALVEDGAEMVPKAQDDLQLVWAGLKRNGAQGAG
eukprot:352610-Chlamydomonas_euryale.AAC.3